MNTFLLLKFKLRNMKTFNQRIMLIHYNLSRISPYNKNRNKIITSIKLLTLVLY